MLDRQAWPRDFCDTTPGWVLFPSRNMVPNHLTSWAQTITTFGGPSASVPPEPVPPSRQWCFPSRAQTTCPCTQPVQALGCSKWDSG